MKHDDIETMTWTVLEYPVVAASQRGNVFVVADRQRGIVEFSETAATSAGGTKKFSVECHTIDSGLSFVVNVGGDFELSPPREDSDDRAAYAMSCPE